MASSPGPRTPETTPRRSELPSARSFTAPIARASPALKSPPEIGSAKDVEVTYTHPNARIFKFQTSGPGLSSSSPGRSQPSSGSLSWANSTERTIAVGPMEIYYVPGSVRFLHSGSLLQPLFPRSQCWCVDGVSKFVIPAAIGSYYRIEVPGETADDLEEVEKLKAALQKLISYEKTPCPFARTFTVDLPAEQPKEARRKRRRHTEGRAKKWKHDDAYGWKPEGWEPGMDDPEGPEDESASASSSGNDSSGQEETEESMELTEDMAKLNVGPSARARAMQALRSASISHQSTSPRTPPPKPRPKDGDGGPAETQDTVAGSERHAETTAVRTFQSIPTSMPPSPPDSSAGRDSSDIRVPAEGWVEIERTVEIPHEHGESIAPADEDAIPGHDLQAVMEGGGGAEDVSDVDAQAASTGSSGSTAVPANAYLISEEITVGEGAPSSSKSVRISDQPVSAHAVTATEGESDASPSEDITDECQISPSEERPMTARAQRRSNSDDPYAAIQARIMARRSLSGTTSFHPLHKSPTRGSASSTSSAATLVSNKSSLSYRSQRQSEDLASTVVKRVYSVFLGPPAHLVALMLNIAARLASGTFGVNGVLHVESPAGSPRRPPGSYYLQTDGENVEAVEVDDDDDEEGWEDHEDDFGVKLNQPVSTLTTSLRKTRSRDVD